MKLALTADEAAFREELRAFYTTKIPEDIRERVRQGLSLSKDQIVTTQKILNEHGLAVPNWPVEWGGKDWTPTQHQIWSDEMQLACVPEPLNFNTKMVGPVIAEFGSQEIKERFLPPTANIDIWWCQGLLEPEAGSDLASLRTTAVRDGDSYVVNGQKNVDNVGPVCRLDLLPGAHRPAGAQAPGRHFVSAHGHGDARHHPAPDQDD